MLDRELSNLSKKCREAGAVASTVIATHEKVVVFYKDSHGTEGSQNGAFEELHIQPQKKVRILIAVFVSEDF